ncbi:MAG: hypothetical protein ACJ8AG_31600 [Ktedonobacteraceae bacterium]
MGKSLQSIYHREHLGLLVAGNKRFERFSAFLNCLPVLIAWGDADIACRYWHPSTLSQEV